jgi:hypothetical protein
MSAMIGVLSRRQARRGGGSDAAKGRLIVVTNRVPSETAEPRGQAPEAVRQVEFWYRDFIDAFVVEGRVRPAHTEPRTPAVPSEINGSVLAYAHEQAWRHAVVRAQASSNALDWAALTVVHESTAYEHLLGWTAATYGVPEVEIRAVQTSRGYRHHPR